MRKYRKENFNPPALRKHQPRCAVDERWHVRIRVIFRDLEQTSKTEVMQKMDKNIYQTAYKLNERLRQLLDYETRLVNQNERPK